ncbi:N-acetylglucosamine kinase [Oceanobacillus halophilus]|uniref:ATPase BadF/BadG/BcrA/BcrD type domain-containing protein n=1 Tax=Oceanobacillus halophilus TaxID=930130 RepID=A0A495A082_9BACI|nr:BadF/BadG/BcrA/BcrD ATPase family protein [Oceanobacillus halophilus]RKQ32524.1 hypothetical protein D8M06_12755 [Oceanobacillus halophilus]
MINGKRWIGMDGGGTKTQCVIGDEKGQILAMSIGESTNIQSNSHTHVKAVLFRLIDEVIRESDSNESHIETLYLCLSGSGRAKDRETIEDFFKGTIYENILSIENDAIAALAAGTWGEPGIVIIAGTGSIAYGINPSKMDAIRVGGWGYLFGDEGSGYWIGKRAIQSVLKAYDGRGDVTELSHIIKDYFRIKEVPELISVIHGDPNPRLKIASAAPLVLNAAERSDPVAKNIIHEAMENLINLVDSTKQRMQSRDKWPIVIHGGLFSNSFFREQFMSKLKSSMGDVTLIQPNLPPVIGAYIMALRSKDILIDDEVQSNVTWSWNLLN